MTAGRRKQVSTHVMEKVALALQQIAGDPTMPRTKVQVGKLTGLGRDTVSRAFRQDREQPDRRYRLTERFAALQDAAPEVGESASGTAAKQQVKELRQRVKDLEATQAAFAQALLARELDRRRPDLRVVPDQD